MAESRLADFAAGMSLISAESLGVLSARLKELRQRIAQKGQGGRQRAAAPVARARGHFGRPACRQASDLATLSQLQREAAASRLIHAHFLGRLKETAARAGAGRAESRLLAAAETPLAPGQPQPLLAATLAVLALAARIMLAEAGRQTLRSPDELAGLGVPVLGQTLARAGGGGKQAARAAQAELDAIAAMMMRQKDRRGQGKSTTSEKGGCCWSRPLCRARGMRRLHGLAQALGAPSKPPRVLLVDPRAGRGLHTALTRATKRLWGHPGAKEAPEWAGTSHRPPLDQVEIK